MADFYRKKKKICQMCAGKSVDYKDPDIVKKYVSADKGKIIPRRITGASSKHQRHIANFRKIIVILKHHLVFFFSFNFHILML